MSYEQPAPSAEKSNKRAKPGGKRREKGAKKRPGQRDPEKMLDQARQRLEDRRWKDAAAFAKRALDADRNNPVAMALLAFASMHLRRFNDGNKMLKRALEAGPMEPEVHDVHGRVLHSLGKLDAAANAFTHALQLNPQFALTYRNLGILLLDAGIRDQAIEALVTAIKLNPRDDVAFYHLGLIKKSMGLDAEAIDAYSMAVALNPNYAEAHINLSKIAIDRGKLELGEKACRRAIEIDPKIAQAHVNLGMVLREQKKLDEALVHARKGADLDPSDGAAQSNLGNVYMDLQRYQEALSCFRRAMEFQPSFATSYFNYGNALRLLHVLDKAEDYYNKAIELDGTRGETHHNQGLVYQEKGDHELAREKFREAIKLSPNHLGLQFSLGLNLWKNGFFEESWQYLEKGMDAGLRKPNRRFRVPRWQGEDISDKRILVWREQGVGDEIGYGRRFQHIIDKAGEARFEVDKRLLPIFQRSFPKGVFIPEKLNAKSDMEREDCDVQLPAMNLYQFFPFTKEEVECVDFPEDDIEAAAVLRQRTAKVSPYLQPDPKLAAEMAKRFAELPEGLRIGISWRSQYSHRDRDIHYTKLDMWEPILKTPGAVFVNIQYDEREDEIRAVEEQFGVKIHRWPDIDLKSDLEAAFALTSQLDMAITASTSPGRIANSLGKEVWIMTAGGSRPNQPVRGEYASQNRMIWRRFWKEDWSAIIDRVARTLAARIGA